MTLSIGKVNISIASVLPIFVLLLFNPPTYVGTMLFCALLHEAGHLITVRALGASISHIDVMLFGAHISANDRLRSYPADAFVYASGAIANMVGAVAGYVTYLCCPLTEIIFLIFANLFYAFFNMLPIKGLDGGGFAESLLLMRYEPEKVCKVVEKVSMIFIVVLFFVSLWVIYSGKNNLSMLFVVVYLFMNL